MKHISPFFFGAVLLICIQPIAGANELRLGLSNHDVRGIEGGLTVQGQFVLGDLPQTRKKVKFRPFVAFSANSAGNLITGGGGIQANIFVSEKWFLEFQGGIIGHNGQLEPPSLEFPQGRRFDRTRRLFYGCPALFHLSPAVGRRIGNRAHLSLYYIHSSHGGILCGSDVNDGIDNIGARVGFSF